MLYICEFDPKIAFEGVGNEHNMDVVMKIPFLFTVVLNPSKNLSVNSSRRQNVFVISTN